MKIFITICAITFLLVAVANSRSATHEFHPPASTYWKYCGHGVWAWHGPVHYASCPFAMNIARGIWTSPYWGAYRLNGTAYSPVTHRTYAVRCYKRTRYAYLCAAGVGAYAWIE